MEICFVVIQYILIRPKLIYRASTSWTNGTRGPGSEWARERKGPGAKVPGSERARELIGQGAKVPRSELARVPGERIGPGAKRL